MNQDKIINLLAIVFGMFVGVAGCILWVFPAMDADPMLVGQDVALVVGVIIVGVYHASQVMLTSVLKVFSKTCSG